MFRALSFFLFAIAMPSSGCADGLSTTFSDVLVRQVIPSVPQRVLNGGSRDFEVNNLGDSPIRVVLQARVPSKAELRGEAIPVPDATWLTLRPSELILPPHKSGTCRVVIRVPADARTDQVYQAMIWSRGLPLAAHGLGIETGLSSRIRFRVHSP